jgi:hypothetical protein
MRHAMRDPLDLGVVPASATIGGHFHLLDGSATGPGQAANLVESATRQLVSAGRESDDRFGPDLVTQRSGCSIFVKMPKVVVVHVVPVHHLDPPQILGMKNSLEAGDHQP